MKDSNGDLTYLVSINSTQRLTDHLGSVVAITDDQGNLISQQRYLPFGATRQLPNQTTSQLTDYGYTGQRNLDDDIGLMDYKFRFYSPTLGRFILPDNIVPDAKNPQTWNRYSYVNNRPINFNDPTGHCPLCAVIGGAIGSMVGAAYGAGLYVVTTAVSNREFNVQDYQASVLTGAAGGTLIGAGIGAANPAVSPSLVLAGTGVLSAQTGYSIAAGKNFDRGEMLIASTTGGIGGLLKGITKNNPVANTIIDGGTGAIQYGATQIYNGRKMDLKLLTESAGVGLLTAGVSRFIDKQIGVSDDFSIWMNTPKHNWLETSIVTRLIRGSLTSKGINSFVTSTLSETANNLSQGILFR